MLGDSASDGLQSWRKQGSDVEYSQDVGKGAERQNYLKRNRAEKINGLIIVRQNKSAERVEND